MHCNKYPEGPALSLATKKSRVIGKWKIEKFYVNSTDHSDWFNGAYFMKIMRDGSYDFHYGSQVIGNYCEDGTWELTDKKTDLTFNYVAQPPSNGFGCGSQTGGTYNAEIRRLKSNQLWLQQVNSNGDILDFHFKSYVRQH